MTTATLARSERKKAPLNLDMTVREYRPRTPPNKFKQLEKMGIATIRDLLTHLPRTYENRSRITPARNARDGNRQTFEGYISAVKATAYGKGTGRQSATVYDTRDDLDRRRNGLHILWFGQKHLVNRLEHGDYLRLNGMVNVSSSGFIQLYQPEFDVLSNRESRHQPAVNTGAVIPMYSLTQGMTQDYLRRLIHQCLEDFQYRMERSRPGENEHTLSQILWTLHFPKVASHPALALAELAADEVLELQIALLQRRQERLNRAAPKPVQIDAAVAESVRRNFPFALSDSQLRAIAEIRADMSAPGPVMNRLLQGEVGSGKTVVALNAALDVASAGMQCVLLAPTELLAEQHFQTISELTGAEPSPVEKGLMQVQAGDRAKPFVFGLLTASAKAAARKKTLQNLELGYVDLVIGTHSLLSSEVKFRDLGLAIADEQHRFGTEQRATLRRQAHYLMLTATPIPRTLQLTLYRDLDISSIDKERAGKRPPTRTEVISDGDREKAWQEIAGAAREGRQTFVVCPFIEPSDIPGTSVSEMSRILAGRFPDLRIETIHGQMKSADQDQRMRDFRDRNTDILVATAVIEVGIDIPNAAVMVIESAERFGMAQLHQLRGRIGRGEHPGVCFLTATPGLALEGAALNRLVATAGSTNGMELAAADLHNRGEGQLAGNRQSGRNKTLRTGSAYNLAMLEREREIAEAIHARDPELALPEHRELRQARARMLARLQQDAAG